MCHFSINHLRTASTWDADQNQQERKDWWIVLWMRWNGSIWRGRHLCLPLCLSLSLLPLSEECRGEASLCICQGRHMDSSPLSGRNTHKHTYNHILALTTQTKSLPALFMSLPLIVSALVSHSCHATTVSLWLSTSNTHSCHHRIPRVGGEGWGCVNTPNIINVYIYLMASSPPVTVS